MGADGAQRHQAETVVLGVLVAADGGQAQAQRHDKGHRDGPGGDAAGVKGPPAQNCPAQAAPAQTAPGKRRSAASAAASRTGCAKNATTRKMPTPAATVRISHLVGHGGGLAGQHLQVRLGNGNNGPIRKQHPTISHSFFDLVNARPTCSPMGIMAISAPSVKKPMPMIKNTAPTRNSIRVDSSIGAMVMPSASTISVTGSTELRDSCIFALSFLFILAAFLFRRGRDRLRRSGRPGPGAWGGLPRRNVPAYDRRPFRGEPFALLARGAPKRQAFPTDGVSGLIQSAGMVRGPGCGCCAAVRRPAFAGRIRRLPRAGGVRISSLLVLYHKTAGRLNRFLRDKTKNCPKYPAGGRVLWAENGGNRVSASGRTAFAAARRRRGWAARRGPDTRRTARR